jgi:hypothetical protein
MAIRLQLLPVLVLASSLASPSRAQEVIFVEFPAKLATGAVIADRVFTECNVEERLGGQILHSVLRLHSSRTRTAGPENVNDKVLKLTILNVVGSGGGAYSGQKFLQVRADIVQSGQVLVSREFERPSRKSLVKGTCRLLEIAAKDVGREVALWLPPAETLTAAGAPPRVAPRAQAASERRAEPAKVADPAERMRELKQLRDEGLINDSEYEQKRSELLKAL